jgi:hypothetical protein
MRKVANTMTTTVMIKTLVLMTIVMNILDVLIPLSQWMITTNVLMITVAQLREFTILTNQFLLMTPVLQLPVILTLDLILYL